MRIDPDRRSGRLLLPIVTRLIVALLAFLRYTCRRTVIEGAERIEHLVETGEPVVLAFWHNRAVLGAIFLIDALLRRGYRMVLVSSLSRDGELSARFSKVYGVDSIRGSSSRGGRAVLSGCYRAVVKERTAPIISPDGPRGPAYELKVGTIAIAQIAGVPVLPLGFAVKRSWALGSWDRLMIPRPFSRVAVAVGEPLAVPRRLSEDEFEAVRLRCQDEIDRMTRAAEAAVGASDPLR